MRKRRDVRKSSEVPKRHGKQVNILKDSIRAKGENSETA